MQLGKDTTIRLMIVDDSAEDAEARALHPALAARLSGYLVPRLVREVAGDSGKRPL